MWYLDMLYILNICTKSSHIDVVTTDTLRDDVNGGKILYVIHNSLLVFVLIIHRNRAREIK